MAPPFPAGRNLRQLMTTVLLALLPGIAVGTACLGAGVPMQLLFALTFAWLLEAIMLKLRAQAIARFLTDGSASLTAVLFALLVPPSAPWWIAAVGMTVAIVISKHLFGGLGRNLFNPAMAGLAAVKLAFPHELDAWPAESGLLSIGLVVAYALGGIFLLWKRIIPWQTPMATLIAAAALIASFLFLDPNAGPASLISMFPATMVLGAFFVVTDPVTGCISARGRVIFGASVGALGALIWHFGGGPAGLAFAVLLMNGLAPWIDRRTRASLHPHVSAQEDSIA